MVVTQNGTPMEDYQQVMAKLKGFKGVLAATPFIYNQVMLSSGKNVSGVVLRGIDVSSDRQVTKLSKSIVEGLSTNSTRPWARVLSPSRYWWWARSWPTSRPARG